MGSAGADRGVINVEDQEHSPPAGFDALLGAAREGQESAWQRLFADFAPAVAGYLRVQGAVEVDDLVSEVFIGLFRGIATFVGGEADFRSWVFVIAHHRLVDERRRRGRRRIEASGTGTPHEDTPAIGDVASAALDRMGAARVVALCERLVPDQRDVLVLRIIADLTIEQIADVVGKSAGAVKALQRRGLAAVQREIAREGVPL